jgi:hypothetical protein
LFYLICAETGQLVEQWTHRVTAGRSLMRLRPAGAFYMTTNNIARPPQTNREALVLALEFELLNYRTPWQDEFRPPLLNLAHYFTFSYRGGDTMAELVSAAEKMCDLMNIKLKHMYPVNSAISLFLTHKTYKIHQH